MRHWTRLSIDLDPAGNVLGASWELHQNDQVTGIHVLEEPGPFDAAHEVFDRLVDDVGAHLGWHGPLPLG